MRTENKPEFILPGAVVDVLMVLVGVFFIGKALKEDDLNAAGIGFTMILIGLRHVGATL